MQVTYSGHLAISLAVLHQHSLCEGCWRFIAQVVRKRTADGGEGTRSGDCPEESPSSKGQVDRQYELEKSRRGGSAANGSECSLIALLLMVVASPVFGAHLAVILE
ncbi:hypothetical protein B0T17DRAFT_506600 [Bombardia bombarda]|uniref:Uncharacterized protein n=1 Tax=Bombardia bombarda TaxID=252184 RepID=A0AA39XA17_9PEZI|nr:hypothetical protein B0T17DRAFT_506600 [Bombardia bombarda]